MRRGFTMLELLISIFIASMIFAALFLFLGQFRRYAETTFAKNQPTSENPDMPESLIIERLSHELPKALWAEERKNGNVLLYLRPESTHSLSALRKELSILQVELIRHPKAYIFRKTLASWNRQDFLRGNVRSMKPISRSEERLPRNKFGASEISWKLKRLEKKKTFLRIERIKDRRKELILIPIGRYQQ